MRVARTARGGRWRRGFHSGRALCSDYEDYYDELVKHHGSEGERKPAGDFEAPRTPKDLYYGVPQYKHNTDFRDAADVLNLGGDLHWHMFVGGHGGYLYEMDHEPNARGDRDLEKLEEPVRREPFTERIDQSLLELSPEEEEETLSLDLGQNKGFEELSMSRKKRGARQDRQKAVRHQTQNDMSQTASPRFPLQNGITTGWSVGELLHNLAAIEGLPVPVTAALTSVGKTDTLDRVLDKLQSKGQIDLLTGYLTRCREHKMDVVDMLMEMKEYYIKFPHAQDLLHRALANNYSFDKLMWLLKEDIMLRVDMPTLLRAKRDQISLKDTIDEMKELHEQYYPSDVDLWDKIPSIESADVYDDEYDAKPMFLTLRSIEERIENGESVENLVNEMEKAQNERPHLLFHGHDRVKAFHRDATDFAINQRQRDVGYECAAELRRNLGDLIEENVDVGRHPAFNNTQAPFFSDKDFDDQEEKFGSQSVAFNNPRFKAPIPTPAFQNFQAHPIDNPSFYDDVPENRAPHAGHSPIHSLEPQTIEDQHADLGNLMDTSIWYPAYDGAQHGMMLEFESEKPFVTDDEYYQQIQNESRTLSLSNATRSKKEDLKHIRDQLQFMTVRSYLRNKIVASGRVMTFGELIIGGNGKGLAGFGYGRGITSADAMEKAKLDLMNNLLYIPLSPEGNLWAPLEGKDRGAEVKIHTQLGYHYNRGSILLRYIFELAGIRGAVGKTFGNKNFFSRIRATFKALSQASDPIESAQERGVSTLPNAFYSSQAFALPKDVNRVYDPWLIKDSGYSKNQDGNAILYNLDRLAALKPRPSR